MKKIIAAMMLMALTATTASADNKRHHDDRASVTIVHSGKAASHFDRLEGSATRHTAHPRHARHDIKVCTFPVSRHAASHHAVAKAERINGVQHACYNPRTGELTVTYDAFITSAQHIIKIMRY